MKPLLALLQEARNKRIAIGHFNAATIEVIWAICRAAQKAKQPVVIGFSEGERGFTGVNEAAALVRSIAASTGHPIYLNADHTYSLEAVKPVVAAKFDAVVFDAAGKDPAANIAETKAVVAYVKANHPDMVVEAEVGYIGTSSSLIDEIPENAAITPDTMPTPAQVADFVTQTDIDLVAPAVGNIHGMLKNAANPNLDIDRIQAISRQVSVPLVLHGGSGITDEQFKQAIVAGIAMIHLNTELRRAWRSSLDQALAKDPQQISPYKLLAPASEAVEAVVKNRLDLFAQSK